MGKSNDLIFFPRGTQIGDIKDGFVVTWIKGTRVYGLPNGLIDDVNLKAYKEHFEKTEEERPDSFFIAGRQIGYLEKPVVRKSKK